MLFIPFEEAWDVYLRAAPRLPDPPAPVETRRIRGLAEVIDDFDLVVFDAYGVLHEGQEAYPGTIEQVAMVRQRGKRLCILTNDVIRPPHDVAARLCDRGFDIGEDDVVSGRDLLPDLVARTIHPGQRFGLISSCPEPLQERFPDLLLMGDERAAYDSVDGFVLVDSNGWEQHHADHFLDSLTGYPRPVLVCNPDVGCPYHGQVSAEPGYFAHLAAERAGVSPVFLGKPYPGVYQRVFDRFPDVAPSRMVMVGDSPHTDILGARSMGMACLLLDSGFLRGQDAMALFAQSGLWPNFVSSRL